MLTNEQLDKALATVVAGQIIQGLSGEDREKFLTNALAAALNGYSFKNAVEQAVAAKAAEVTLQLLDTPEWEDKIRRTVLEGFNDYLSGLRGSVTKTLHEAFHGGDGSYGSRALLLKHFKLPEKA